jgi:hypothetical protein
MPECVSSRDAAVPLARVSKLLLPVKNASSLFCAPNDFLNCHGLVDVLCTYMSLGHYRPDTALPQICSTAEHLHFCAF